MRTLLLISAMVARSFTGAFAGPAAAKDNLIKDGGFEKPAPPVGGFTVYQPGHKKSGWVGAHATLT